MKNNAVVSIVLVLVGLGVGFGGGYFFRNYQITQARTGFAGVAGAGANGTFQRFTAGRNGTGAGRSATTGSILSMDSSSMTVKMADGSSKIVLFSGSTTYSNTVSASQSDLKTGQSVAVFGTPNSDGSITATNVQLNPQSFRPQGSPMPQGQ